MNKTFAPTGYQIEQAMSALQAARQRLLEDDPEIAADESLMADILGSDPNTADAMDVLHRVLRASVYAKDMAEAADTRAAEMTARRDRYRRRADALRGSAFAAMDALGLKRVELPDMTASLAAGRPAVVIVDEAAIPDAFVKTERKVDKSAIGEALKRGDEVAGAMMNNGLPSLQVRTR